MSKKVNTTVILITAITFVASIFPFSGVTEAAEGKTKILFIPFTMEHVFQKELCDGAKIPIEGYDLEVIVEDPYGRIERELEILETYMTQDIDGVVMYPIDSQALVPVVQEMKDKKMFYMIQKGNVSKIRFIPPPCMPENNKYSLDDLYKNL